MKLLLDTHVLVRWLTTHPDLAPAHATLIEEAAAAGERVGASDTSLWEIAKLVDRGRLTVRGSVDALLEQVEEHPSIAVLPITARIAVESTRLGPTFPRDPADQIIAATARCHSLRLLTLDEAIRRSGVVAVE